MTEQPDPVPMDNLIRLVQDFPDGDEVKAILPDSEVFENFRSRLYSELFHLKERALQLELNHFDKKRRAIPLGEFANHSHQRLSRLKQNLLANVVQEFLGKQTVSPHDLSLIGAWGRSILASDFEKTEKDLKSQWINDHKKILQLERLLEGVITDEMQRAQTTLNEWTPQNEEQIKNTLSDVKTALWEPVVALTYSELNGLTDEKLKEQLVKHLNIEKNLLFERIDELGYQRILNVDNLPFAVKKDALNRVLKHRFVDIGKKVEARLKEAANQPLAPISLRQELRDYLHDEQELMERQIYRQLEAYPAKKGEFVAKVRNGIEGYKEEIYQEVITLIQENE